MASDNQPLYALRDKAHDLRQSIVSFEEALDRTHHELAVVTATLTVFKRDHGRITDARPAHVCNLFKRGVVIAISRAALSVTSKGMKTRDLGIACIAAREFDLEDPMLIRAMVGLLANTMRKHARKRELVGVGDGNRKAIWRLIS